VAWLTWPPLRTRQDDLIDDQLSRALQLEDAWQRDWGLPTEGDASKRVFYSFVDLQVFNGGDLLGLWVDHVKEFRKQFETRVAMMDYLVRWTQTCLAFTFTGKVQTKSGKKYLPRYKKLYRSRETPITVHEWRRLAATNDPRVNEEAINLIALGFLRARISNGDARPNGFHGIF
jgi:hypothetical protein